MSIRHEPPSVIPRAARLVPAVLLASALALLSSGCGNGRIFPVEGVILDKATGQPVEGLEGGTVEFQPDEGRQGAQGVIGPGAKFRMTTETSGDGATPGTHKVMITRRAIDPEKMVPRVLAARYEQLGTTDLKVTVEAKSNYFELKVDRLRKR